jgi:hypothetical protein
VLSLAAIVGLSVLKAKPLGHATSSAMFVLPWHLSVIASQQSASAGSLPDVGFVGLDFACFLKEAQVRSAQVFGSQHAALSLPEIVPAFALYL